MSCKISHLTIKSHLKILYKDTFTNLTNIFSMQTNLDYTCTTIKLILLKAICLEQKLPGSDENDLKCFHKVSESGYHMAPGEHSWYSICPKFVRLL